MTVLPCCIYKINKARSNLTRFSIILIIISPLKIFKESNIQILQIKAILPLTKSLFLFFPSILYYSNLFCYLSTITSSNAFSSLKCTLLAFAYILKKSIYNLPYIFFINWFFLVHETVSTQSFRIALYPSFYKKVL